MSKQISAKELAEIVTKLLTDPEGSKEFPEHQSFEAFMTAIAKVVCTHCGGEIRNPAAYLDDICYIGIHGNDQLPNVFGGVWRDYDKEGELYQEGTPEWFKVKYDHEHPQHPRSDWQYEVANGDTKLGYWTWVAQAVEAASNDDTDAPVVPANSAKRNIFVEAMQARFVAVSDPKAIGGYEELMMRGDIVANEVLGTYAQDIVISREVYDADPLLAQCLNAMNSMFEFPIWEGKTIGKFQVRFGIPGEPVCMNVIQYKTREYNKDGIHAAFVNLQEMWDATPAGENSWRLKSGIQVSFMSSI